MPARETWWAKYQAVIITLSLLAVGVPIVWGIQSCARHYAQEHSSAKPRGAIVSGANVLFFDDDDGGNDAWTRITSVDTATGQVTGRRSFDHVHGACEVASPERVWCQVGALEVLDARTLQTVFGVADLLASHQLHAVKGRWTIRGATMWLALADGGAAEVDAATGTVKDLDQPPIADNVALDLDDQYGNEQGDDELNADDACETTRAIELAGQPWSVGPGRSAVLRGEPGGETTQPAAPKFGKPQFLADSVGRAPLAAGADPLILTNQSVVRIAQDGHAVWTTPLPGACNTATVAGDALVISTPNASSRVLAIDLATGQIRWRAGY